MFLPFSVVFLNFVNYVTFKNKINLITRCLAVKPIFSAQLISKPITGHNVGCSTFVHIVIIYSFMVHSVSLYFIFLLSSNFFPEDITIIFKFRVYLVRLKSSVRNILFHLINNTE